MTNQKVGLFINGELGLDLLRFLLKEEKISIHFVMMNTEEKRNSSYLELISNILEKSDAKDIQILAWDNNSKSNFDQLSKLGSFDYGISVMFGHLIPESIIKIACKDFCNLHPSLLPIGRGAHPIPWAIIEKKPQGITIHRLNKFLDDGEILIQNLIETDIGMNAGEIYKIALEKLYELFTGFFPKWIQGEYQPVRQEIQGKTFHKSSDLQQLKVINHDVLTDAETFLRRIQAVTFDEVSGPIYVDPDGNKWRINLVLEEVDDN